MTRLICRNDPTHHRVELVRLYSNPQARPETLLHLRRAALSHRRVCEEAAPRIPQRVDRRLGQDLIKRVVSEYAGGISTNRLARAIRHGKGNASPAYKGERHHHPKTRSELLPCAAGSRCWWGGRRSAWESLARGRAAPETDPLRASGFRDDHLGSRTDCECHRAGARDCGDSFGIGFSLPSPGPAETRWRSVPVLSASRRA